MPLCSTLHYGSPENCLRLEDDVTASFSMASRALFSPQMPLHQHLFHGSPPVLLAHHAAASFLDDSAAKPFYSARRPLRARPFRFASFTVADGKVEIKALKDYLAESKELVKTMSESASGDGSDAALKAVKQKLLELFPKLNDKDAGTDTAKMMPAVAFKGPPEKQHQDALRQLEMLAYAGVKKNPGFMPVAVKIIQAGKDLDGWVTARQELAQSLPTFENHIQACSKQKEGKVKVPGATKDEPEEEIDCSDYKPMPQILGSRVAASEFYAKFISSIEEAQQAVRTAVATESMATA